MQRNRQSTTAVAASRVYQPPTFRPRRSHEKSKSGCVRCKQQRKKCDESKPGCGNCARGNHQCHYARQLRPGAERQSHEIDQSPTSRTRLAQRAPVQLPLLDNPSSRGSSPVNLCLDQRSSPGSQRSGGGELDRTELSLFTHFLTHTAPCIAYDAGEVDVLQVGVPNIALCSPPVMSSLLALSAACRCNDLISSSSSFDLGRMSDLLALADVHHQHALHEIQFAIPDAEKYGPLLANAALMVLYSLANQCVRIQLAQLAVRAGASLPKVLQPCSSQWMHMTRAAHTACIGVLTASGTDSCLGLSGQESLASRLSNPSRSSFPDGPQSSHLQGAKPNPRMHVFSDLVESTYKQALLKLRSRVDALEPPAVERDSTVSPSICIKAFDVLDRVAAGTFAPSGSMAESSYSIRDHHAADSLTVPFWLADYLARVTSVPSSQPVRRTIMSFLNYIPFEFLEAAGSIMESLSDQSECLDHRLRDSTDLDPMQMLVVDIMAHWLVFVMLLTDVWWIGDLGEWELGRLVELRRENVLLGRSSSWQAQDEHDPNGGQWWPEDMYRMKRKLMEYRT